ncbi:Beta-porphyranase A precursor [Planctomycetes bacterium MalM25]|nr:Beta-porphyranase A precursor [Planctomycetes bacterium MalM25]
MRVALALIACGAGAGAVAQTTLTIETDARSMTGGVRSLDRAQFFNYHGTLVAPNSTNLGNLVEETWSADGLNIATGRHSTDLDQGIAQNLPEDPTRPDYIDPAAAVAKIQGDYRNHVLNSSRWEPLREGENPIFIQNGRNGGFWPDYLDSGTQMPTNYEAYADFLNVYFEEVVYGPNAFLPIPQDRFYFEIMNEPQWTGVPWNDVIDLHRVVTEQVKEAYPQLRIGGTSSGDKFEGTGSNTWSDMKALIDDMTTWQTPGGQSVEFDYWTIHNYERYDVAADGSYEQAIHHSPGHVVAIMDLFETYSHNTLGDPKQFAITEYGSWNRTNMADGSYGDYARDEQQWDLVRDVREQLLVYMDRPDRIINATPFVSPRHWQNAVPTNPAGDNVFWEQDASGDWVETIVGNTFRMYSQVRGEYVKVDAGDPDLQSVAYRDGNQLYVMLNNLRSAEQEIDLETLGALGVTDAKLTRTFRLGGQNFYLPDTDVSGSWQDLTLQGEEGALLVLTLAGAEVYDHAHDSRTTYSADTEMAFSTQSFLTTTIDANTEDAVAAKLRFGFSATSETLPTISVRVNGNSFTITPDELELDDNDFDLVMREIEVPVDMLNDGQNDLSFFFPFSGSSGTISAAVLEVTRSIGDYNGGGKLDGGDLDALYQQFGAVAAGDRHDLTGDGQVNAADVNEWLALRNTLAGDADVDGDLDTRDAVAVLANRGASGVRPEWTRGNFDADGDVDGVDVATTLIGFTGAVEGGSTAGLLGDDETGNPNLVYDPATGELHLAPAGLEVLALSLSTDDALGGAADFSELDAAIDAGDGWADDTEQQAGWVSAQAAAGQGVDGFVLLGLGLTAPAGLDEAVLANFLSAAEWAGDGIGGQLDLVVLPTLPGDFNADGVVDAADYTVWRDAAGSTSDLAADANGDAIVDDLDYAVWRANYGVSATAPALAGVPEPTALLLTLTACSLLSRRR